MVVEVTHGDLVILESILLVFESFEDVVFLRVFRFWGRIGVSFPKQFIEVIVAELFDAFGLVPQDLLYHVMEDFLEAFWYWFPLVV